MNHANNKRPPNHRADKSASHDRDRVKNISDKKTIADRIIHFFQRLYTPVLNLALRLKAVFVIATVALFVFSFIVFSRMGGEFIPTLDEGDLAMQQILPPGTSLSQSIEMSKIIQKKLLNDFPEIEDVIVNIGAAEIPTDPMPVEIGDYTIVMKPKDEWTSASNRQDMFEKIEKSLSVIPGVGYEFSQPIQLRFNELMTGSKADIAIKLYGQDLELLYSKAKEAENVITKLGGVGTVNVEQTIGMPQIIINFKYDKMAQYGLQVKEVNQVVRSAFAGESAGVIYEGEKRFDLVVRLDEKYRSGIEDVQNLYITLDNGTQVPLTAIAKVELIDAPMQISRENTNRRIVIGVNVGDTDVETLVGKIQTELDAKVELPAGYYFTYGGQFENLKAANARLAIAVPLALALIFILLFFTFGSISQAALIFTAIPLSAIGGIWALELRGMPFSISAGIGFIALFGVAVLNGIVLIGYFNQLKKEGMTNIRERIIEGTSVRLRPVLLTASVASLGFLPMALSNSGGAEVQRPLATVVIGGLITATFLTLVVLPILYSWLAQWQERKGGGTTTTSTALIMLPLLFFSLSTKAQQRPVTMDEAIEMAVQNHPIIRTADLQIQQSESLQDLPYSLGDTEISYQGNGLFRENGQRVNQIGVVQNIPHHASVKAQNALQNEVVKQGYLGKELTERKLILQVKQTYLELQQRKELQQLYEQLIQTYEQYFQMATVRVDVGAANRIEKLTLQSALNEYRLLLNQSILEIGNREKQLANLLNTDQPITSTDSLTMIAFSSKDSLNSLQVQIANQGIMIEQANIGLLEADLKPDFNIGYSAQNYFEGGLLHGLQAGVQIPLFNKQTKQKVEAQKLQVEVAKAKFDTEKQQLNQELLAIENAMQLYEAGANYYQEQLEIINPEIVRISDLNYEAGEISYLELLNTLNISAKNQISFWEQVLAYNKAVVLHQFFTN
ncbi:MAG: CusA/CzcA family heavy metal efflux RND transporter [Chitinophagales bacterium]